MKRTAAITVPVTDDELLAMVTEAKRCRMSIASWMRACALEALLDADDQEADAASRAEAASIGALAVELGRAHDHAVEAWGRRFAQQLHRERAEATGYAARRASDLPLPRGTVTGPLGEEAR